MFNVALCYYENSDFQIGQKMSDSITRVRQQRPPLSQQDLDLLAKPENEIREDAEQFSFDFERLKQRISSGDKWQQLIQAHLYLDHVIVKMLRENLIHPDSIDLKQMSFSSKIKLLHAMGLLPDDLFSTIQFINKLRNNIAHDLLFEMTEKDEQNLRNCTPQFLRNIIEEDEGRSPGPIQFFELLYVLILKIEIIRQHHAFARLMTRKGEIRLRTVLEKTPNAIYRP